MYTAYTLFTVPVRLLYLFIVQSSVVADNVGKRALQPLLSRESQLLSIHLSLEASFTETRFFTQRGHYSRIHAYIDIYITTHRPNFYDLSTRGTHSRNLPSFSKRGKLREIYFSFTPRNITVLCPFFFFFLTRNFRRSIFQFTFTKKKKHLHVYS